ncbi:GAF domain-containing protein [Cytobacillus gottheilii]|uniref:GAF domain-containing protein n=1 Tax=Cytobacillus gottheilii TaxID=859144 RepID=A0ABX8F6J1_9BACI|nr:GAF domain-containing protein [Cytobacillus gottheilii]QVY59969.1 GAF domain-containing protein [Cytobacillus gottheilii]
MENQMILQMLNDLLVDIPCEFAAIAIQIPKGSDVKWKHAAGNLNDKYKRITLRYGKGIAGRVISTGTPIHLDRFPDNIIGRDLEYPIMLAEKLISAYAVPIILNGSAKGVLLVGRRVKKPFQLHEQKAVRDYTSKLEKVVFSHD